MGILSGVLSYLFGLALNLLDVAISGFLGALGFDLDTFESYFPAAADYHEIIVGFAVGILFIMLIFQIFRNFGVVLDMEVEDPLKLLGKTALFFGMIMYSKSIVNFIIQLLVDPYSIFINAPPSPYKFELLTLATKMFTSVFSSPFTAVLALILMLVLGWQFLKLAIECVERYIVFYFTLYCASVVFATGAFKSTSQVFKSWCRMVASQAMLLLLNVWSINLFLSFMPVFEDGADHLIFNFLLGYAFLKFAQKADTLLRILGLNTASTGDMMRSLGGTIAGIAMAIRTTARMAKGAAKTGSKIFGGGSGSDASGSGGSGGSNRNPVGGMGSREGAAGSSGLPGGSSENGGSVTGSGISSAKQNYVSSVLDSAKSQLQKGKGAENPGGQVSGEAHGGEAGESSAHDGKTASKDNIKMGSEKEPAGAKLNRKIDGETMEGLSNLAHGLPHDQFDAGKKSFSGGEFPEFTGEDANLIGASQLTPADGVSQSNMKMADGTTGTVYKNEETGDAGVVQFASVDNGVIQGTISEIDGSTGKVGDAMAFKAVHESVPGARSFSSHAEPVRDGTGGSYYLATGASTSFFAPGGNSVMKGAEQTSFTPGGTSAMPGAAPADAPAGNSGLPLVSGEAVHMPAGPVAGESGAGSTGGFPPPQSMGNADPGYAPISAGGTSSVPGGFDGPVPTPLGTVSPGSYVSGGPVAESAAAFGMGADAPPVSTGMQPSPGGSLNGGASDSGQSAGAPPASVGIQPPSGSSLGESAASFGQSADAPPVSAAMRPQSDNVRRFSRHNPANVEVFRRDFKRGEASQTPDNPEASHKIDPPAAKT